MEVVDFNMAMWEAGGSMEVFGSAFYHRKNEADEGKGWAEVISRFDNAADALIWAFDWVEHKELGEDCPWYQYWLQVCLNMEANDERD